MQKSILQITITILLLAGVSYLGLKLLRIDTTVVPSTTSTPNENTADAPTLELPTIKDATKVTDSTPESAYACTTTDECTVISEPQKDSAGKMVTVTQCLNKEYVNTCINCSTSEDLVNTYKAEANCACISKNCGFELLTEQ